jgi:DNA polymerase-4
VAHPPEPPARRVIAHLDIDAFYASVELLRRPELRGLPLVVAGSGPRAVVTTASYEARRYGIDSAMPAARARVLCPDAVFLPPDFTVYREHSRRVWELVRGSVDVLQQVGIDEGYIDLSGVEGPLRVLRALVADVREATGLVVSVGVGPSRLVAKTVSAAYKPEAFVAMSREQACERFAGAPVRILQGVGPKTAERLAAMGIATVGDLQGRPEAELVPAFGARMARELRGRAHFHDASPVETVRVAKSRSNETTFPRDVADHAELEATLERLAADLCAGTRAKGVRARNVAIKVRLDDWTTVTRARTLDHFTADTATVTAVALELFRAYAPARPVRLLGVRLAAFADAAPEAASGSGDEGEARGRNDPGQLALPL